MRVSAIIPSYGKDFSKSARWYTKSRSRCFRHPEYFLTAVAVLEIDGHEVQFIDATTHDIHEKALVKQVLDFNPEMVVIYCTTPSIYSDIHHGRLIKEKNRKAMTVLIGPHVSALPEESLKIDNLIDVIAYGEFDYTLQDLANKRPLSKTLGIAYRKNNSIHKNKPRPPIENVNELPFPAWHHIKIEDYPDPGKLYPFITLITGRGCPNYCTFCHPAGTNILMSNGTQKNIVDIKCGDELIGLDKNNRYTKTKVTHVFPVRTDMIYKIALSDGSSLFATAEHPWLTTHNRWVKTSRLRKGQRLRKVTDSLKTMEETIDYKKGYILGLMESDGCLRTVNQKRDYGKKNYKYEIFSLICNKELYPIFIRFLKDLGIEAKLGSYNGGKLYRINEAVYVRKKNEIAKLKAIKKINYRDNNELRRGFIAGFYDGDGSWSGVIRISQRDEIVLKKLKEDLEFFGFKVRLERTTIRILGGQRNNLKFMSLFSPKKRFSKISIFDKQAYCKKVSVESVEITEKKSVYNIETACHNFIADGCSSHNCVNTPLLFKRVFRPRSAESIVDEIEYDLQLFPQIQEFMIETDTFTAYPKHVKEFCNELQRRNLKIKWSCNVRVDIDLSLLPIMKRSGCRMLMIGYESGNQRCLDAVCKRVTVEQSRKFSRVAHNLGFILHGCFMFGFPGETPKEAQKTIDFAKSLPLDTVQFSGITAYPGTPIYEWAKQKGYLVPKDWTEWVSPEKEQVTILNYPQFSKEQIDFYIDKALKEFYLRPGQILRMMTNVRSISDIKRKLFGFKSFLDYFS